MSGEMNQGELMGIVFIGVLQPSPQCVSLDRVALHVFRPLLEVPACFRE